jgi:pimeloyl-ACP methyl ester carboxylesterase
MAARSLFFSSFHLRLHCSLHNEDKSSTPIVCIHGFMDHGGTFSPLIEQLTQKYPLALLDRRGYGDSEQIPHGRYNFFANLLDISRLIEELGTSPIILMGHSIGGIIALLYAGTYPEQIEKLVILDSFGIKDDTEKSPQRLRTWIDLQRKEAEEPKKYPSVEDALSRLRKVHGNVPEDVLNMWGRMGIRENPDGTASFKHDPKHKGREPILFREDVLRVHAKQLSGKCPTLAVRGTESVVKEFPSWLDEIENLTRAEIAGGHMCHLENAPALLETLRSFLEIEA